MKRTRCSFFWSLLLICIVILVGPKNAYAISMASAEHMTGPLNFSGIPMNFTPGSLVIATAGETFRAQVSDGDTANGFADLNAFASIPAANGEGSTTSGLLVSGRASALPENSSTGFARAGGGGAFTASLEALATGVFTITADFQFRHELNTDSSFDFANTVTGSSLVLNNGTARTISKDEPLVSLQLQGLDSFSSMSNVPLSLMQAPGSVIATNQSPYTQSVSLFFNQGDVGGFTLDAVSSARAAVPEPSTFLLLGSGLTGLGVWRWRTAKRSKR